METLNVRLVSRFGQKESWYVAPGDERGRRRALRMLEEYRKTEPSMGWNLETRGDVAEWHKWEV